MNEEVFNTQVRKLLKKVGINAQRAIEQAVHKALADGRLRGDEQLAAQVTLHVSELDLELLIEDTIALE